MSVSLAGQLRFQARLRPDALAVLGPAGSVSYRELVDDVDRLATELLERGLTWDDLVGLHLGPTYLHVLLILALDRIGVPSMSFPPPRGAAAPERGVGATVIVSGAPAPDDPPCRWIRMAETDRPRAGAGAIDAARLAALDGTTDGMADDLRVRVIWSSGTTGGMKGAPITRTVQRHRIAARRLARGLGPATRYVASAPFAASPGYIMPLATLTAGGVVLLLGEDTDFVTLSNAFRATATSITPPRLAELVAQAAQRQQALETMTVLMVSGGHLPVDLARQALARLTPHIWIGYGATETDGVAQALATVMLDDPSAVGFLHPWVDAEIVDPADRPLPAGQEGVLRLRSAATIAGYAGDGAATRRNFRRGWFYPGDVGALTEARLLRITGRVEDMIVRRDITLAPDALEDALRELAGVRDVAVFALPGSDGTPEICAAIVPAAEGVAGQPWLEQARARLGDAAPTRLFTLDRLPRNANGKLLRRELAAVARRRLQE